MAKVRVLFCGFLNTHFTTLPDEDFVGHVRQDHFSGILNNLSEDDGIQPEVAEGASLMRRYIESTRGLETGALAERLGVDRTRLYRGISPHYGPPPPYEALWGDAGQGSEVLQDIVQKYRQGGFTVKEDIQERVDYIGLEFDYMEQLGRKELLALEAQDEGGALEAQMLQEVFMREHLGRWVPLYVAKVLDHAETDFYRGHLHMLNGFVKVQGEVLKALTSGELRG